MAATVSNHSPVCKGGSAAYNEYASIALRFVYSWVFDYNAWEALLHISQRKANETKYDWICAWRGEKHSSSDSSCVLLFALFAHCSAHFPTKLCFPIWPACYWTHQKPSGGETMKHEARERFDSYMKTGTSLTLLQHLQLLKLMLNPLHKLSEGREQAVVNETFREWMSFNNSFRGDPMWFNSKGSTSPPLK